MSETGWWMLGFTYDAVVDAWQDARLADAIERAWLAAQRPAAVKVFWTASADEFAFRWYLNGAAAELLDQAKVTWRSFVVGQVDQVPETAKAFLGSDASAKPDG